MQKFIPFILLFLHCSVANSQEGDHYFRVLYKPKDALQCRIDLIQQAQKEILLSYYILKDDRSGSTLLNLLAEAAKRGVIVQILMDRNGSKISAPMRAFLAKNGVVIHRFFLKNKGLKKYYHGLHEKVFIVDSKFLIVGGRNLKDNYYNLAPDFNFFDYDALVTGDSVLRSARLHFYTLWHDVRLSSPYVAPEVDEKKALKNLERMKSAAAEVTRQLNIQYDTKTDWLADCKPASSRAGFIKDDFYVKKGRHYILSDEKGYSSTNALISFIDSAKQSVLIENPYFVPTKGWNRAFNDALQRGVKIRLMTNSLHSTDLVIRQAAYMNRRKKLLRQGIEIWEFQGPQKLHAKAMVVDEDVVVIGSYNIHRPSERYNTEVAVWTKNNRTALDHLSVMSSNLENALQIGSDNRPIRRPDKNFKSPSFGLRAKAFLLRYTIGQFLGWLM